VTARCHITTLTGSVTHAAPGRNCTCGLYAYTQLDPRLKDGDWCIAAIAAWGDLEVHSSGFRAQHACVVALAAAPRTGLAERELIARSAERYGVKAVPLRKLAQEGTRHARPLSTALSPPARPGRVVESAPVVRPVLRSDRHYAPGHRVWVFYDGRTARIGVTPALGKAVALSPYVDVWAIDRVERGDVVATVTGRDGTLLVHAPLAGAVERVNPRMESAPELLRTDPYGTGWILDLRPEDWERDALALRSGDVGTGRAPVRSA
jgi:glycine cleavage system H protein